MRYFQFCVLFLVIISSQVFGELNATPNGKTKFESDMLKTFSICDVIWSEEKGNRHPLSQEIRTLVDNPTSVDICDRIRQSACSKNNAPVSNSL